MSATFNAKEEVAVLAYDLTAFGGSSGEIPEPSDKQVSAFMKRTAELAKKFSIDTSGMTEREAYMAVLDARTEEAFEAQNIGMLDAIVSLTNNHPPKAELLKMPYRVKRKFAEWVMDELVNPGKSGAGTT